MASSVSARSSTAGSAEDSTGISDRVHVIGRGFIGLTVAYELTCLGRQVTIVGPEALPGSASRAAVGVSSVKGQLLANQPLFAAKLKGHEILSGWLAGLEADAGRVVPRNECGVVEPFGTLTGFDGIRERVFHRAFTGCHRVALLDAKDLAQRFPGPWLEGLRGSFHYYRDLWFDPRAALRVLEEILRQRGALFDPRPVTAVLPHPDRGLSLRRGSEQDDNIPISQVVLAAGQFSAAILAASGLSTLRLEAVPGDTLTLPTTHPDLLLRQGKVNLVAASGRLWVGSTAYRQGETRPDPLSMLHPPAFDAFLSVSGAAPEVISGVRSRLRDRAPAVGPLPYPQTDRQLWVALGFYKNGLQLGPLFAQHLARKMSQPPGYPQPGSSFAVPSGPSWTLDPLFSPTRPR